MEATVIPILRFLQGPKQFFIPIFQRMYSWEISHCQQLWKDIVRIGENPDISSHFLGSIVYMEPGVQNIGVVRRLLVIDGQQRLTTLSVLLSALSNVVAEQGIDIGIDPKRLSNYYLFNIEEEGELRYKQLLTKRDKETLICLLENRALPAASSSLLKDNYRFFEDQLRDGVDIEKVYIGIQKLKIVDIMLDPTEDNPQLIFESLNSTGLSLSSADLIRNYVLMGQEPKFQNRLYETCWFPMEADFGDQHAKRFDGFVRDYLTFKTRQIPKIKSVYEKFKEYLPATGDPAELECHVKDISRYAKHYIDFALLREKDPEIKVYLEDIQELRVDVVYPFLLEIYEDYAQKRLEKADVIEILRLIESYVFRRAVCNWPTNRLNRIFSTLLLKVDKSNYLRSLKRVFSEMRTYSHYPKDDEFKQELMTRDVYNFRVPKYLLRKLENYERKEPINVENYTIEHVMPQDLTEDWQWDLGEHWGQTHERWLHTIGNLTLTGYNPEYRNLPFKEKRDMPKKGFRTSPLYLNERLAHTEIWDEANILARGAELVGRALKIWIYPDNL